MVPVTLLRGLRVEDPPETDGFPWGLPAVRALEAGKELHPQVTFLVGDNGSGKSTIVEALAAKLDLDAEGGDRVTYDERVADSPLHEALRVERGSRRPSMRYFLRAESFFNVARGTELHELSHGESFLRLAAERFMPDGLFVLDEPEAALSPQGCLTLLRRLRELCLDGAQFVIATHSPFLLAYPDATIYDLSDAGIEAVAFEDTDHYRLTKAFLDDPARFVHHLMS